MDIKDEPLTLRDPLEQPLEQPLELLEEAAGPAGDHATLRHLLDRPVPAPVEPLTLRKLLQQPAGSSAPPPLVLDSRSPQAGALDSRAAPAGALGSSAPQAGALYSGRAVAGDGSSIEYMPGSHLPFKCPRCRMRFANLGILAAHMYRRHNQLLSVR